MGTYLSDANAVNMLAAVDLSTDGTATGSAVQVNWPQEVTFRLTTGTVTGVNSIAIQGSESSTFAGTAGVTYGGFNLVAADDDDVYEFTTKITSKYIRAFVTIGTGGDIAGSTLYMQPVDYLRTKANSTTDLVAA